MKLLQRLWKEESGQGLVEYGLLVGLIVVIVIAVLVIFRESLETLFNNITTQINEATGSGTTE